MFQQKGKGAASIKQAKEEKAERQEKEKKESENHSYAEVQQASIEEISSR